MDSQTRTGKVFLQSHKPGKKWKAVWMSLVPASSRGLGRLEIQDYAGGDHGTRRIHQPHGEKKLKVVRLTELLRVLRLPPQAEACPMEDMSAFCVETQERTMVFAALKDDSADWVEKLCQCTRQGGGGTNTDQLHMEENQIYASADEVRLFWTVSQRTEAATRCGLQGAYWLEVGREALQLREPQKKSMVKEWPFELLRRYGRDKLTFTIEAGRRCESGPGTFTFETPQAEKIFSLIQSSIKRKTLSTTERNQDQNQEGEKVLAANIRARSPLPRAPDVTVMAALLDTKLRTQDRKSPVVEDAPDDRSSSGPPAPITLMPLPSVPIRPSSDHHGQKAEPIYADPFDCLQSELRPEPDSALYVDPASVLPLKPPGSALLPLPEPSAPPPGLQREPHDGEYSEVYDLVGSENQNRTAAVSEATPRRLSGEPIYAEPLSDEHEASWRSDAGPDPFAHLYAQVCKRGRGPPSTGGPLNDAADEDDDDVIYENLGII